MIILSELKTENNRCKNGNIANIFNVDNSGKTRIYFIRSGTATLQFSLLCVELYSLVQHAILVSRGFYQCHHCNVVKNCDFTCQWRIRNLPEGMCANPEDVGTNLTVFPETA